MTTLPTSSTQTTAHFTCFILRSYDDNTADVKHSNDGTFNLLYPTILQPQNCRSKVLKRQHISTALSYDPATTTLPTLSTQTTAHFTRFILRSCKTTLPTLSTQTMAHFTCFILRPYNDNTADVKYSTDGTFHPLYPTILQDNTADVKHSNDGTFHLLYPTILQRQHCRC